MTKVEGILIACVIAGFVAGAVGNRAAAEVQVGDSMSLPAPPPVRSADEPLQPLAAEARPDTDVEAAAALTTESGGAASEAGSPAREPDADSTGSGVASAPASADLLRSSTGSAHRLDVQKILSDPPCAQLEKDELQLARQLMEEEYVYACCDRTIAACLADTPACRLAVRLARSVCRRVAAGEDAAAIRRGLSRRARSMTTPRTSEIDLSADMAACVGPDTAAVVLVEYACARCPYCARITPQLYDEVTGGRLSGHVRFCFKVFPIRSHPHSKETGLGFMAAIQLGRFWPFALYTYAHFDQFCLDKQDAWAEEGGMNAAVFQRLVMDAATHERLVASKKEGLRNQVDATPTFFVNGRRYVGDMELEEMIDVLLEETERMRGLQYVPR